MAVRTIGNVTVTYDGDALTAHLNTASMEAIVSAIDTTNLASTANEQTAGSAAWSIGIGGQWSPTLDGYLGPDAVTPPSTLKTLVVVIGVLASPATYTWTTNSFLSNYTIDASDMQGVITWSGTLAVSGAPVRT